MTFPATTTALAVYAPHHRARALRLVLLRLAEAGAFAAALGTGAACYGVERIGLHRPAESLAVATDHVTDVSNRVSSRINELGAVAPHPRLLALYRLLGGEALDARLVAMIDSDDPLNPGPLLTDEELAAVEAAYPAELLPSDGDSVYVVEDQGDAEARAVAVQYAEYGLTADDRACWPQRNAVDLDRAEARLLDELDELLDRYPLPEARGGEQVLAPAAAQRPALTAGQDG
ncbi:hypothetical protein ACFV1L_21970 [Kitasatospora sp. NPDC059646]|uniref:hypothetical protein n=1 Tax=Kitasatospora sp. NPDC059646 TaxID=3346893 RepID=UPI00367C2576